MEFKHLSYEIGTGTASKIVETYNFHKAAAVLAEYGLDCIRLSDDWMGADFLAHHKTTGKTIPVQLKTGLVIDQRYEDDLYMCFPLDGTEGTWYLVRHGELVDIIKRHAPDWFEKYKRTKDFWHHTGKYGHAKNTQLDVLIALEQFAYRPLYRDLGYREARRLKRDKHLAFAKVEPREIHTT